MKKFALVISFLLILLGQVEKARAQTTPCCQGVTSLANEGLGLNNPAGMAIDYGRDRLYVVESANKQLMVYTSNGNPVTAFAAWSGGQFNYPIDVSVDAQGNVYVADFSNGEVEKFDNALNFVGPIVAPAGANPRGVWVENTSTTNTAVYFSIQQGYVYLYEGSGSVYSQTTSFGGPATLNAPTGLVKVGTGLYVTDTSDNRVIKFDLSNNGAVSVMVTGINPYGIRTDLAGFFYVTSYSTQTVDVFRPDFTLDHPCTLAGGPWGVVVNAAGEIFVGESLTGSVTVVQGCIVEPTPTPSYNGLNPPDAGTCFIYPSPARGDHATVSYNMAESGRMDLKVWNEKAELEAHVTDQKPAGIQITPFSICGFASGVYFYVLTLNYDSGRVDKIKPKKFVILH